MGGVVIGYLLSLGLKDDEGRLFLGAVPSVGCYEWRGWRERNTDQSNEGREGGREERRKKERNRGNGAKWVSR